MGVTFPLTTEERWAWLKSACDRPSNYRFSFSAARNASSKATDYATSSFYFRIFSPSMKFWMSLFVNDRNCVVF